MSRAFEYSKMEDGLIRKQPHRLLSVPPAPLIVLAGGIAVVAMAWLGAAGRFNAALAVALCAAMAIVFLRGTVEGLLVTWFAVTPIASFFLRIPWDRSIVTFNRAVFVLAAAMALRKAGAEGVRRTTVTRFEVAWAVLSLIALANAVFQSQNTAAGLKIAVDTFWLPLIAFHIARHHFSRPSNTRLIFASAMLLALLLVSVGALEFVTGSDLFPYRGAELIRAHERRVNGPFASDSSFAAITLILLVFLIEAPRALSIRLDSTARLVRAATIVAALAAALLPLFRGIAMAMAGCWIVTKLSWRRAGASSSGPGGARTTWLLVVPLLIMMLIVTGYLDISRLSSRLADPHNVLGRLSTWNAAAGIMLSNPAAGVGIENYQSYFFSHYNIENDPVGGALAAKATNSPHSNFLWIGAEMGVPALAIYTFALWFLLVPSWRALKQAPPNRRGAAVCSLALIAAYVIPGLELTTGYYSDLNLYFFFLLGLLANRVSVESIEGGSAQT